MFKIPVPSQNWARQKTNNNNNHKIIAKWGNRIIIILKIAYWNSIHAYFLLYRVNTSTSTTKKSTRQFYKLRMHTVQTYININKFVNRANKWRKYTPCSTNGLAFTSLHWVLMVCVSAFPWEEKWFYYSYYYSL